MTPGKRRYVEYEDYDMGGGEGSSSGSKRYKWDAGEDSESDEDMSDPPVFTPEIMANIMEVSGDRDTMYELAMTQRHVAGTSVVVFYDNKEYPLRIGQLHPRLCHKYAALLVRDLRLDNEFFARRHRRPMDTVTIEEFVRDTQIRLGAEYSARLFSTPNVKALIEDHAWAGDLAKMSKIAHTFVTKFGKHFTRFLANAIRVALDYDVEEHFYRAGRTVPQNSLNPFAVSNVASESRERTFLHPYATYSMLTEPILFPSSDIVRHSLERSSGMDTNGKNGSPPMKFPAKYTHEELVRIFWACMSDKQQQYLTARHPLYLEMAEWATQEANVAYSSSEVRLDVLTLEHYFITARLMLLRNKAILERGETRGYTNAHAICEMISYILLHGEKVDGGGTDWFQAGASGRRAMKSVPLHSKYGPMYLDLLLRGSPPLYDMLQKYLVVDIDFEFADDGEGSTVCSLTDGPIGQFATVPLALGVARWLKMRTVESINAVKYCSYAERMLYSTRGQGVIPLHTPGWSGEVYARLGDHLRDRYGIAWKILYPADLRNRYQFHIPTLSAEGEMDEAYEAIGIGPDFNGTFLYDVFIDSGIMDNSTPEEFAEYLIIFPRAIRAYMEERRYIDGDYPMRRVNTYVPQGGSTSMSYTINSVAEVNVMPRERRGAGMVFAENLEDIASD